MILYNVTINIEDNAHDEWLRWMREEHIPEVMATGLIGSHKMFRILTRQDEETGTTYCVQYLFDSIETYNRYRDEFAPELQAKTAVRFGGKFVAWRTLLEEV